MNQEIIKLIIDIDSSITFNEDSEIFMLGQIDKWNKVALSLKNTEGLDFDYLMCITSLDLEEDGLMLAYNLHSIKFKKSIEFNLIFNENQEIPSVEHVWKTANWHEREAYDMMGIKFSNHPELKRILLPDDWEGHPLKKDYKVQDYYHGIYVPKDKTTWE
tara:strand:- start:95 stop:574 length:480 start_codon:yes stop_codon:yes gene_type:complete